MKPAAGLMVVAAGLAAVFGAAFAGGSSVAPLTDPAASSRIGASAPDSEHIAQAPPAAGTVLPGLAVSQDGYTLEPSAAILPAGRQIPLRVTVTGPDNRPVGAYLPTSTKDLHLILVRRDLAEFQHVHPVLTADGTWNSPVDLVSGGSYRIFADFTPAELGRGVILGADLHVPGDYQPVPLPAAAGSATVDGFEVTLDGAPIAGTASALSFTVRRDGADIGHLETYLGAFGHLVALRAGDLAYLHTHPAEDDPADAARGGPVVPFLVTFPTAGSYRLFLDFQADGTVHTAAFTLTVPPAAAAAPTRTAPHAEPDPDPDPAEGGVHGY